MDRVIYTSLSTMRGSMARQTAVANNLANVQTPGFRAEIASAQSVWLDGQSLGTRAMASEEVLGANMAVGTVVQSGRALDIALQGDTLLTVQAANGDVAYTRRGDLQLSPTGLLTTGDGLPVQGAQGPITVGAADSISIDNSGRIFIVPPGGDPQQPVELDRLKLVTPAGSDIAKGLDGLFRPREGGILPEDPAARLVSGAIEGSNVNSTSALVEMIEASKAWDVQLKLISSVRDMDNATSGLMRLPS